MSEQPNLKAASYNLSPGAPPVRHQLYATSIFIDTAAVGFLLSLNGEDYVPVHEGQTIRFQEPVATLWLKSAGTAASVILITGNAEISDFTRYGGGIGSSAPAALMPYESAAELGNTVTSELATGVYAILFEGDPPAARTWQLRAWVEPAPPVTDPAAGQIVPVDYDAANARVWFRS
jgi:hypothetical protein